MSRIVFFCIPAHGHTNPTLAVVKELIARGNEVIYYSYDLLREKIEATGATFVSCDRYDAEQTLTPKDGTRVGADVAFSTKLLVDTTLALDEPLCSELARWKPDCIVADSMAIWGKAIAGKLGIPLVISNTTFAFNRYSSKIMKKSPWELVGMLLAMPEVTRQVRRLQERGYPVKSFLDLIGSDDNAHTIVYTSPQFQPASETFSHKFAFVGPSIRPPESRVEKTRDRLVYLSMGTVNNAMLPLYRRFLAALGNTEYQVILSVGSLVDPREFGELPENVSVFPQVDQIAVLEQADVFVSHCGMNSVSESLYFGVPLVMLPQTAEQKGVARRVAQLGAGVPLKRTDKASILAALNRVLSEPSYRQSAEAIAEGFRSCPGPKGAADKILAVCKEVDN